MADDLSNKASEWMKKVLTLGVGTIFLTEESLRGLVSDLKLPKELLASVLESANKTRKEFLQNLSADVLNKLAEKVDLKQLAQEILEKNEIEFSVKMKFNPKDETKS